MEKKSHFQLFVALPTDDVCTVKDLSADTFVYQLKSKVELKTGIPGDILHLYFMNAELANETTLGQCKLKHGCIVRIRLEANWIGLFEACWRGDIYDVFQNGVQYLDNQEFSGYNITLWNRLVVQRAQHALFIACHRGYLGLILELLNHGAADMNGKSLFGRTALHVAAYQGFVGCVSLLLSEGAIVNQLDTDGKSPLILAQENGHVYCEKRLWLYQWNLGQCQRQSRAGSDYSGGVINDEVETSPECSSFLSRGSADGPRASSRNVKGKTSRNELRESSRASAKETQVHLPRVQTPSGDALRHSRSLDPTASRRSSFPLVAIAEKYRKQYKEYQKQSHELQRIKNENSTKQESPFQNSKQKVRFSQVSGCPASLRTDEVEVVTEVNKTHPSLPDQSTDDHNRGSETGNSSERVTGGGEVPKRSCEPITGQNVSDTSQDVDHFQTVNTTAEHENPDGTVKGQQTVAEAEKTNEVDSNIHKDHGGCKTTIRGEVGYKQRPVSARPQARTHNLEIAMTINRVSRPASPEIPRRKRSWSFDTSMNKTPPEQNHSAAQNKQLNQSLDFKELSEYRYINGRPPETYESWLERKRAQARTEARPTTAPAKSHFGKSLDTETFKKWVANKRHNRLRESSESHDVSPKKTYIKAGLTFERWLESKKGEKPRTSYEMIAESHDPPANDVKRHVPTSGKRFEEWLEEKKRLQNGAKTSSGSGDGAEETNKNEHRSGKSFEEWLQDKSKQKQIEVIHKLTTQKEEDRQREMEQFRKYLNPHCMTFEEWLEVKRQDKLLERIRSQNEQKEDEFTPKERKEDAKLVFNVWMTMKQAQELQDEECKYSEMKAKWEAKEREREQLKRLNIIDKLKKKHKTNETYIEKLK